MASLARLLCEAVENEDAKEVENLLKRGADANLVLPTGIAAIHLAAGKESESALRCLTLLLQQGGNPNVRSIEELTPVHVAASWGCYKTLVFLLRKGGDPGLQDQEGNRASDLALEEGNRRCVVALQEYSERVSDGAWPDQSRGNCRNDSSLPDNITQLSSISHLLESSSDCSPFSSTRNSPLTPLLRNEHPGKCMDDAVTASQVNLQGLDATRDLKVRQRPAESRNVSTVLHPSVNPETTLDDSFDFSITNSMVLSSTQLTHTSHRITDTSGHLEMHVIGADSLPLNTMIEQPNTSMNAHSLMSSMHDLKRHSRRGDGPLNKGREAKNAMGLCRNERDSTVINSPSKSNGEVTLDITAVSRLLISQSVTGRLEGLDVTSPDHVYMYSREAAASDDDWEKTLVIPHQSGDDNSEEQVLSSSSKYNSCESECYASLGESSHSNEKRERSLEGSISDDFCHQSGEDKGTASQIQPYRTLEGQRSALRAVETLPKKEADMQRIEHLEQGGAFTQRLFQLNGHEEGMSRECVAPSQSQDRLFHHESNNINLLPRVSETLCSSESPTLSVGVTGVDNYGSCNQILKDQLRHLMLSTKGCRTNLPVGENQLLPGSSRSATVSVSDTQDTLPVMEIIGQTKYVRQQDQEFTEQLKAMMVLTKLQVSPTHSNATLDTLVIEPAPQAVGDKVDVNLSGELKRMMMSTKAFQSPLDSMDRPCFFTPRTKSRLRSSNSRHNSSSSLFDDTLDMPKRVRRIRSPDGLPQSPHTQNMVDKSRRSLFPISTETKQTNSDITLSLEELEEHNLPLEDSRIPSALTSGSRPASATVLMEPETPVNISNFFTDDLSSSDTDRSKSGPCFHHMRAGHCVESQVSGNTWLTEDGEEESSGDSSHKDLVTGSSVPLGKPHSVLLGNGSLLHSTLLEDPVGKGMNATRAPRYSFSRLSCVRSVERPPNPCQLSTIHDSGTKDVPLSPGGRPVNVSQTEPMEYLYIDPEKGHALIERHVPCTDESATDVTVSSDDTIIYDWRDCKREQQKGNQPAQAPPNRVAVELYRLSNDDIARRLKELGEDPGPVTSLTRKVYISLLDKRLKEPRTRETNTTAGYSPELSLTLRTFQIPDCHTEELTLSQEFDQPDKTRKWREGVLKSSFNYLLLDPRVTRNLPSRCHTLSQSDCFRTFVSSIFYVGKGKRSRPYCHLYEALTHHKTGSKQLCSKVQHILDIWSSGLGVISLHCFQNTIPVEAYTREACIVDGIGLKMLTNQKKGVYYGQALSWSPARRRCLGVHMLHRALQIFLAEGERQLRPADIRTGQ